MKVFPDDSSDMFWTGSVYVQLDRSILGLIARKPLNLVVTRTWCFEFEFKKSRRATWTIEFSSVLSSTHSASFNSVVLVSTTLISVFRGLRAIILTGWKFQGTPFLSGRNILRINLFKNAVTVLSVILQKGRAPEVSLVFSATSDSF